VIGSALATYTTGDGLATVRKARVSAQGRTTLVADLRLDLIPVLLRDKASDAYDSGDALGLLGLPGNEASLELVAYNAEALQARGIYEEALLEAFIGTRTNNLRWPVADLARLFDAADRSKLRAAGEPLPGPGPFVLYGGVAGRGADRRVRGLSWTGTVDTARWFANRFELPDPAVYRATVAAEDVLAYLHADGRDEAEFIVRLPTGVRPRLVERQTHGGCR